MCPSNSSNRAAGFWITREKGSGMADEVEQRLGKVEVQLATMAPTVEALREEIWNHEGRKGIKTLLLERWAVEDDIRSRRWKRSDKIAAVAVLSTIMLPPLGYLTYRATSFFGELYQITQDWEKLHKSELEPLKKKSAENNNPVYTFNRPIPQDATIPHMGEVIIGSVKP